MIEVQLGKGKGVALLDDCDANLAAFRWSYHSGGYAVRGEWSKRRWITMHREVLGLTNPRVHADHINRNKLDNRRANLRVVTPRENSQNIGARLGSRYRGARRSGAGWIATDKRTYPTEMEAARAAEAYRRQHMPGSVPDASLEPVPSCVCRECAPERLGRSERRRETLASLWADGLPVTEIAARLGVKPNSLNAELSRLRRQGVVLPYRRVVPASTRAEWKLQGQRAAERLHPEPESAEAA